MHKPFYESKRIKPRPEQIKRQKEEKLKEREPVKYKFVEFDEQGRPQIKSEDLKAFAENFVDFLLREDLTHDEKLIFLEQGIAGGLIVESHLLKLFDLIYEKNEDVILEFDKELMDYILKVYPHPEKFVNFLLKHQGFDEKEYPEEGPVLEFISRMSSPKTREDLPPFALKKINNDQIDHLLDYVTNINPEDIFRHKELFDALLKNYSWSLEVPRKKERYYRRIKSGYKSEKFEEERREEIKLKSNNYLWKTSGRLKEFEKVFSEKEYLEFLKKIISGLDKMYIGRSFVNAEKKPNENDKQASDRLLEVQKQRLNEATKLIFEKMNPKERADYFINLLKEDNVLPDMIIGGCFDLDKMDFSAEQEKFLLNNINQIGWIFESAFDFFLKKKDEKFIVRYIKQEIDRLFMMVKFLIETNNFDKLSKSAQKEILDYQIDKFPGMIMPIIDKLLDFRDVMDFKKLLTTKDVEIFEEYVSGIPKAFQAIKNNKDLGIDKKEFRECVIANFEAHPEYYFSKMGLNFFKDLYPTKKQQKDKLKQIVSFSQSSFISYLKDQAGDRKMPALDKEYLVEQLRQFAPQISKFFWGHKEFLHLMGSEKRAARFMLDNIEEIPPDSFENVFKIFIKNPAQLKKFIDYAEKNFPKIIFIFWKNSAIEKAIAVRFRRKEAPSRVKSDKIIQQSMENVLKENIELAGSGYVLNNFNHFSDLPQVRKYFIENADEIIRRNPGFVAKNYKNIENIIGREKIMEQIDRRMPAFLEYLIENEIFRKQTKIDLEKEAKKYPHVLLENGYFHWSVFGAFSEMSENKPLEYIVSEIREKKFYQFWKGSIEKEYARLKKANADRVSPTIERLAERICLLSASGHAQKYFDEVKDLPESERDEHLAKISIIINLGLENQIEFEKRILPQLENIINNELKSVFNLQETKEISEKSEIFKEPEPFIIYMNNHGNKLEINKLMREIVENDLNGTFYNWRKWAVEKSELTQTDKKRGLNIFKQKELLPAGLTLQQYESWLESDEIEMEASFEYEIENVRQSMYEKMKAAIDNNHIDISMRELTFETALNDFLRIETAMKEKSQTLSKLNKIVKENKKRSKRGEKLILFDEEEYEALKQEFYEIKENLNQAKERLFISRLINISAREIIDNSLYLKGPERKKQSAPISKVFSFLRNRFSDNQVFCDDLENLNNIISQYQSQEAGQGFGKEEYLFTDTDDLLTMMKIGERPVNSCQSYKINHPLAESLISYCVDPNTRVFIIKKPDKTLVARAVVRILGDENGKPYLLAEPVYSVNTHPKLQDLMANVIKKKARKMKVKAVTARGSYGFEGEPVPKLYSKNSRNISVYVDSIGRKPYKGYYSVVNAIEI